MARRKLKEHPQGLPGSRLYPIRNSEGDPKHDHAVTQAVETAGLWER